MDVLLLDPVTGRNTGLGVTIRRTLRAMQRCGSPYCVIGATALAVRGLPRMTRDLDLVVMREDAPAAIDALRRARLRAETPVGTAEDPEPMIVFVDPANGVEVDLHVAVGDPEATVCAEARSAPVFGVQAPVATLEHLLLLYLYSNRPKHLGDFASIVTSGRADLAAAEQSLRAMHPEMLAPWRLRVRSAREPAPAPPRPAPRRRRPLIEASRGPEMARHGVNRLACAALDAVP